MNKEIEGQLNYEVDLLPNLKYFSYSDRRIINMYFKDGYTVEALAKEYNVTVDQLLKTNGLTSALIYPNQVKEIKNEKVYNNFHGSCSLHCSSYCICIRSYLLCCNRYWRPSADGYLPRTGWWCNVRGILHGN